MQKKYPIGRFIYGKTYSAKEVKDFIEDIEKFPKQLKKTLKKLKGEEMDMPYRPNGWTVRQVIHHLADSHMNAYIRMKLAVTENTPSAKTYEEGMWAELPDGKSGSPKLSIRLLSALHKRWTVFLKSTKQADMGKGYFSPGAGRVLKLDEAIALYSWHGRHHLGHIKLLTGWEPAEIDETEALAEVKAATDAPKKRGPKPKLKETAEALAPPKQKQANKSDDAAPTKRKRRSSEEVAAEKAAKAAMPKLTRSEILAKARATAAANRAAEGKAAPAPKGKGKRGPKPKAASDAPKLTKTTAKNSTTPIKRIRRSKEQIAADNATAAAAKAARPPIDRAAQMAKARAAAAAKRAATGFVPKAKKESTSPKRIRRSKEEIAADKAAAAAAKANRPPIDRGAQMAKARAVAAANRVAKGIVPKPKPVSDGPKMTKAEALAKGRAVAAANRAAKALLAEADEAPTTGKPKKKDK